MFPVLRRAHETDDHVVPPLLHEHGERKQDGRGRHHHVSSVGEHAPDGVHGHDVGNEHHRRARVVVVRARQQARGGDAQVQVVARRERLAVVDAPHGVADHLRQQEQVLHQPEVLLHGEW